MSKERTDLSPYIGCPLTPVIANEVRQSQVLFTTYTLPSTPLRHRIYVLIKLQPEN